jgi:uncharacterized protein YukE
MRPSDGGGPDPLSNGGNTWHFKLDGIYPGSTSGMNLKEVKVLVEPIQPDRVAAAGASYQRASQKLTELASNLISHSQKLAGAWGGAAGQKAISQMRQLHDTAIDLANISAGTASVLHWYGSTIQPWYKSQIENMNDTVGDKVAGFLGGTDPANTAAANQLAKLNARTVEAYNSIPPTANKNLPPLTGGYGRPGAGSGGSGSGAGGGSGGGPASGGSRGRHSSPIPASRGSGASAGSGVDAGNHSVGGGPGSPVIGGGHGTLSGFNPTPGAAAAGGPGIGGPGGPALRGGALNGPGVPGSGGPIFPGPVIGGSPSGAPGGDPVQGLPIAANRALGGAGGESVVGEPIIGGSLVGGEPGGGEAADRGIGVLGGENEVTGGQALADGSPVNGLGRAGEAAAGEGLISGDAAGAVAVTGPAFRPVGPGPKGRSDYEHSTWLTEDRDIWNDESEVTPPVIG